MKFTVTVGMIEDKFVVIKDPSERATEHTQFISDLTNKKGLIGSGKTAKQVKRAVVLHSTKGVLKRRTFK